jgi:photosystem II stability/assembly factor-like uncharacterized protein
MKNKFLPILAVMAIAVFLIGMYTQDPSGVRNPNVTPVDAINPTVPQTNAVVKFVDSLNGISDSTGLRSRGYIPKRGPLCGPPGGLNNWIQGVPANYPSFNGPPDGYTSIHYTIVASGTADCWLILPAVNIAAGDTLSFYERSPTGSTFPDSCRVYYAANGDTVPGSGSFVELGKFQGTITGSWNERRFTAPTAGANGRFAINYRVINGGPSGTNSDYFGVDYIRILGPAAPTVTCNYTGTANTSGTTSQFFSVDAVSNLVAWGCGAAATVRRTTDGGTTWTNANPNPGVITGDVYNIEALDANTAFVTTSPGATFIYKTTNGGTNWTQVFTQAAAFINAIKMVTPVNGYAFGDPVAGNWLILTTVNAGVTWNPLPTAPPGTGDGRNNCLQVTLPDIWFGTGQGSIVRSTNAGLTWTTTPTAPLTTQILGLRFNSPTLGLLGGASMVRTTNGGTNWTAVTVPGTGNISGIDGSGNEFFCVRGTGLYRSTDGGVTFTSFHTATGTGNDLKITTDPNGCFTGWSVATLGNIAEIVGTPVGIVINNNEVPSSYMLQQNYPNPFNPTTNIKFSLPNTGLVKLVIFDVVGREVATLVNEVKSAGNYTADFDASTLSSGVYFYRLEAGDFAETKKMLLVK